VIKMSEISLEKVDLVVERTGVTYAKAKEALIAASGDVLDAIIYLENQSETDSNANIKSESVEEFKIWLKELINKGNVTRIKIKKDEKEIVDVPVNAGIAATAIALVLPPVLAVVVVAAVATKITIEITMEDGTVEVVNKYISKAANEVKDKASSAYETIKNKIKNFTAENNQNVYKGENTVYSYTVKFDEDKENTEK
jgi:hypothetical protein